MSALRHAPLAARVLTLVTLVVIGTVVWITLPHGGPIVSGAVIAAAVAFLLPRRRRTRRAHATSPVFERLADAIGEPVVSLALTARPLVLPLLAALAIGTFQLLWPIQLAAGAVFVATGLILVDAKKPPMSYPGSWGAHDETVLQNFKVDSIARGGPGPLTPPLQWLWKQPLLKIFCNYSRPSRFVVRFCPPGWS